MSLAWLLSLPGITAPIIGAGQIVHLDAAVGSLNVVLQTGDIEQLEADYVPHAGSFVQDIIGPDQDA